MMTLHKTYMLSLLCLAGSGDGDTGGNKETNKTTTAQQENPGTGGTGFMTKFKLKKFKEAINRGISGVTNQFKKSLNGNSNNQNLLDTSASPIPTLSSEATKDQNTEDGESYNTPDGQNPEETKSSASQPLPESQETDGNNPLEDNTEVEIGKGELSETQSPSATPGEESASPLLPESQEPDGSKPQGDTDGVKIETVDSSKTQSTLETPGQMPSSPPPPSSESQEPDGDNSQEDNNSNTLEDSDREGSTTRDKNSVWASIKRAPSGLKDKFNSWKNEKLQKNVIRPRNYNIWAGFKVAIKRQLDKHINSSFTVTPSMRETPMSETNSHVMSLDEDMVMNMVWELLRATPHVTDSSVADERSETHESVHDFSKDADTVQGIISGACTLVTETIKTDIVTRSEVNDRIQLAAMLIHQGVPTSEILSNRATMSILRKKCEGCNQILFPRRVVEKPGLHQERGAEKSVEVKQLDDVEPPVEIEKPDEVEQTDDVEQTEEEKQSLIPPI